MCSSWPTIPILQQYKSEFPSLPTFYKDLNETRGRPSDEVCNILLHILEVGQEPFLDSPPSSSQYAAPTADVLAFPVTSKADWNCKLFCLQKTTQYGIRFMQEGILWSPITFPWNFHYLLPSRSLLWLWLNGHMNPWNIYSSICLSLVVSLLQVHTIHCRYTCRIHWKHHAGWSSGCSLDAYRLSVHLKASISRLIDLTINTLAFKGFVGN